MTSSSEAGPAPVTMPGRRTRLGLYALLCLVSIGLGVGMMFDILRANGLSALELSLLLLFSITFAWIVTAFWSAVIGFVLQLFAIDPLSLTRCRRRQQPAPVGAGRTAVVMPVYNEDSERVLAGFEASLRSLAATGQLPAFDFWLLSDTQDRGAARREHDGWRALLSRLEPALAARVHYRRREQNIARKVGNLKDFCQRWGSAYEAMIVLDADSIMSGDCMLALRTALATNPAVGLVQTVPIPVRQQTFFGRFLQFASVLYSPMLATGMAFWQTDAANYWGHNAIIRMQAFMDHCGLPSVPGRGPFGGEILSHDFVEAALLRRAGWQVLLRSDIEGSFEELPSNLLDYATRDRRWAQGNIQHLGLLRIAGLHGISRLHFIFGAVAYISSLLWLLMLALSTVDAIARAVSSNDFFLSVHQLFPNWPIAKTGLIFSLISITVAMLLLPKVLGLLVTLLHRRKAFGGALRLCTGAVVEALFAIVIAPLMMVFHAYFVVCVLIGRKVNWDAQAREGRMVSWREALTRTAVPSVIALVWGGASYYFTPIFFWWMSPVLLGLVLAAPLVRYSSSLRWGALMRRLGIFLCPSETQPDPVLEELRCIGQRPAAPVLPPLALPPLPTEQWREMPLQRFDLPPARVDQRGQVWSPVVDQSR